MLDGGDGERTAIEPTANLRRIADFCDKPMKCQQTPTNDNF